MTKPIVLSTLMAAMLLTAPLLWSQQQEQPSEPTEQQTPGEPEPEPTPPPASTDSPFEYESSEQISEDSSVSFPVDI